MQERARFLAEHEELTRRYFIKIGAGGLVAGGLWARAARGEPTSPELADAIASLEPYFTLQDDFRDVSRGNPFSENAARIPSGVASIARAAPSSTA